VTKIRQVDNSDEFKHLGTIWNGLLQKSKDNDIFSTWEWLSCWWKHFGKHRELRVLVAEEEGKTVAIAPLMLSKYSFMNLGKVLKTEFIGSTQSDYNNLIWLENEQHCLKLFLEYLAQKTDWNVLELSSIREGTLSEKLLRKPSADYALTLEDGIMTACPFIELPSTMEEFMAKLKRNMRHQAHRELRRLTEKYKVGFKTHLEFDSIQEPMDRLFELHQKRWESKGRSGGFSSDSVRQFHIDLAQRLAERGWLALSFLTVDGREVAAEYSFDYGQKRYGYQSGFDPAFSVYGVGTLLRLRNIESCIAKGLKEYDLMRGGEPHKFSWPTQVRENYQIQCVRKGLSAKLRRRVVKSKTALRLVRKLGRGGLFQFVLEP